MHIHRKEEQEGLLMLCHDSVHFTIISESQSHEDEDVDITYMFPELDYIFMDGHCNGLFFLFAIARERDEDDAYPIDKLLLWNPATRKVKRLPPTSHGPTRRNCDYVLRGFGFDPNSSDEFGFEPKVVCINFESEPPTAEIYSLKTNSWTLLPYHNLPLNLCANPDIGSYFVNGVCYWVHTLNDSKILSFDFRNNQFHTLKPPSNVIGYFCFITEVNGSVAFVDRYWDNDAIDRHFIHLWILEQDGSWTEMYHVPYDGFNWLYAISQDGAKFLGASDEGRWESYSSEGHSVRHFLQSPGFPGHLKVIRWYVESIAPLSF